MQTVDDKQKQSENKILKKAIEYVNSGFKVLPCYPNGKRPDGDLVPHSFYDASNDEEIVIEWWTQKPNANLALSTEGLIVVDVDMIDRVKGIENPWPPHVSKELMTGAVAKSPSGGTHYFFKKPEGLEIGISAGKVAKGVDIRTDGGIILVEPSMVNEKSYQWIPGYELERDLPVPPDWLIEELKKRSSLPVDLGGEGNGIPHGQQHDTLFRMGCYMRRAGASESEINAALQVANQERCEKPGPIENIKKIAWSATKYEADQITTATVENHFGQDLENNERFKFLTAKELANGSYPVEYLVDDVLVKGQPCILAGPKKCLKTNILLDLSVSMATSGLFLRKFKVPQKVVTGVISGESGEATIQETYARIAFSKTYLPTSIEGLHFCFELPALSNQLDVKRITEIILEKKLEVLFLDPAYLTLSLGDSASNLFSVGEKLKPLTTIGKETGCTIVLVHHTRKSNGFNEFVEPQLEEVAFAGFQEYARQWILLNRRQAYLPDQAGEHKLWLVTGGSTGHSTSNAVNISEGSIKDPGGRHWDVSVFPTKLARDEKAESKEIAKDVKRQKQIEEDSEKVESILRAEGPLTKNGIRDKSAISSLRVAAVIERLRNEERIVPCDVKSRNNQVYEGYKITDERSPNEGQIYET